MFVFLKKRHIFSVFNVSNLSGVADALSGTKPGNVLDSAYMVDVTQTEERYFNLIKGLLVGSLNGYTILIYCVLL